METVLNPDNNLRSTQKRALVLVLLGTTLGVFAFWPGRSKPLVPLDRAQFVDVDTHRYHPPTPIDINSADSAAWAGLRGIGPVLSQRIVNFRESKGGFASVEEIQSVYGLSPETYTSILPYLTVDTAGTAYQTLQANQPSWDRTSFPKRREELVEKLEINSADSAAFRKVKGIGPVLAGRIVKYRSRRGGFDEPKDLLEVYGIREAENFEQIARQVWVDTTLKPAQPKEETRQASTSRAWDSTRNWKTTKYDAQPIDLNRADTTALKRIPGIGSKTANRLVKFRKRLGFFHSVDQLHEVWGLSETNYLRMEPYLFVKDLEPLPHVLVNEWDVRQLADHPYIEYKLAKQMVAYREAHGPYPDRAALEQLYGVPEGTWEKLTPYLRF